MAARHQNKRWVQTQCDKAILARLARELRVSEVTATLLANRGITEPETAHKFLNPSIKDLHDPFTMADMRKAVARILQAIERKEKILIYGDYDVDGTTSTVILKKRS